MLMAKGMNSMRCILNEKKIASIKATNKRQEFFDASLPGFSLRVTSKGKKSFCLMCRECDGKQRRVTLGH